MRRCPWRSVRASSEELDISGVDFERLAARAVAVGILFLSQPALHIYLLTFRQILIGDLCLSSPGGHPKPGGHVLSLTGAVFALLGSCYREIADCRALRG